jgi:ATP-dependent helicase YprA (DUF1998 family)
MREPLDIFNIHQKIMDDYKHFVGSFINIKDEKIKEIVETEINQGKFWPEPLIQFNPSFEQGESAQSLCDKGILHPDTAKIFKGYDLFKHQVEAIKQGCNGLDFVVTSGTGSGKSLTFLCTIFDYLLKNKTGAGIKAVIVYPMNALINSQFKGIKEYRDSYKNTTGKDFPITYAKYTGQEDGEERKRIKQELPDIILTNYMMLELILTRSKERFRKVMGGKRFKVVEPVLPMDLMGVYILLPDRGKNILKDERPTSNVQHRTSNNDIAPLFKLF